MDYLKAQAGRLRQSGATVATTTSADNFELVKNLGADIAIDYKTQDFETILNDYDLVLNSQDGKTLEKSLRILKPNGKLFLSPVRLTLISPFKLKATGS